MSWSETLDWRRLSLANSSGLAVETEEERRARLENGAATKRLMEKDDERKARLEKMVVTDKRCGPCWRGFVHSESWQLSLSFKFDIRECISTHVGLTRTAPPTNTNFRLNFLQTRLQEALNEDLAV